MWKLEWLSRDNLLSLLLALVTYKKYFYKISQSYKTKNEKNMYIYIFFFGGGGGGGEAWVCVGGA